MRRIFYLEHNTDGTVGGSHLCLLEICRHLDRGRYQPVVCFFERNSLWDAFAQTGAELMLERPPQAWRAAAAWPAALARPAGVAVNVYRTLVQRTAHWRKVLRDARIDLVHINNACGFDHDLMLACRLSRIPCVVHERGIQRHIGARTRYFANRVDRLVAISDAVADNLRRHGVREERILRINDGLDAERIAQQETADSVRSRFGIVNDRPVIGIVGNIKPWKGQHVVMEALERLLPRFPGLHCLLVGSLADREYADRMRRRATEMGVPETAYTFTGYEACP
ncbi:MAG TPA: glycosyltransferase family 4 protein, partial [Gammaproteobacteria bacterium]